MTPSQRARMRKAKPKRRPGERYTVYSYRQAVVKRCEKAFGMPDELRKIPKSLPADELARRKRLAAEWRRQHCWHPNQLRHNAATELRREFGIEAARTVLGHSSAVTTEIYAELDLQRAREIIAKVG